MLPSVKGNNTSIAHVLLDCMIPTNDDEVVEKDKEIVEEAETKI